MHISWDILYVVLAPFILNILYCHIHSFNSSSMDCFSQSHREYLAYTIDLIQKSHNAPVPYPTMQHSEQKCAHFCSECCIVGYETGALWDFWNWSIDWLRYNWYCCIFDTWVYFTNRDYLNSIEVRALISNHIWMKIRYVISYSCHNFICDSAKPPLKLWYGCIIAYLGIPWL